MPRPQANIDSIIQDAIQGVISRAAPAIALAIAERAAEELERYLEPSSGAAPRRTGRAPRPRQVKDMKKWIADRNARRVPNFVIEMTGGLDTKKKIVAKYGQNAIFEKGRPAPRPKAA